MVWVDTPIFSQINVETWNGQDGCSCVCRCEAPYKYKIMQASKYRTMGTCTRTTKTAIVNIYLSMI